jgi:hypothetical protein
VVLALSSVLSYGKFARLLIWSMAESYLDPILFILVG